jgi:GSH-dependent disulfide-bond oxidoreductase
MIDLYTAPTPNGWKVAMTLEELNLDYKVKCVDLAKGEQHTEKFLGLNPNGRIPVIVDNDANGLTVFDSNAILFIFLKRQAPCCRVEVLNAIKYSMVDVSGERHRANAGTSGHI